MEGGTDLTTTEAKAIHSYPKVCNLGHPAIADLFDGAIVPEEKIDGSQFSMAIIDGELHCRSKKKELILDAPEKMFKVAVEEVRQRENLLTPGWIYRAEYLLSPKHNTLTYSRTPEDFLVIFDIEIAPNNFLSPAERKTEANRIGLECVQSLLPPQTHFDREQLDELLKTESMLGGTGIEGIVFKNYERFGRDGKVLMGKHVSEAFKERHGKEWKKSNPGNKDILQHLVDRHRTEGRWNKAIQHLREEGTLEDSPRDIGALVKEVQRDLVEECEEQMKEELWKWAKSHVLRGAIKGLPEWYKDKLVEQQFEDKYSRYGNLEMEKEG